MIILKFPHQALLTKCEPVTVFDDDLAFTLDQMWAVMINSNGIGLSANQVGILKRFFVMAAEDGSRLNIVNPNVVFESTIEQTLSEGCLSAPGDFVEITRPKLIALEYQDENGLPQKRVFVDLSAVCAQHEIDHLDGKSFLKHQSIPILKKNKLVKRWGLK